MRKIDFLKRLAGDPYTKLLMHMDGANNGTMFVDSSAAMRAMTAVADAKTVTSNKKFGTAAAIFDGTLDAITGLSSSDFAFGTGDFTIEMWIYINSWTSDAVFFKIDVSSGVQFGREGSTNNWGIAANMIAWNIKATSLPSAGAWHHVAVARASGTTRIFLDGAVVASGADTTNYAQGACTIGGGNFNGLIDEVRISKGIARWTSSFTPETRAYLQ